MSFNDEELNNISKKNLGQLLTALDELNSSQSTITLVKMFFWKNLDDIKMILSK